MVQRKDSLLYNQRMLRKKQLTRLLGRRRARLKRFRVLLALILMIIICYGSYKTLKLPQWYLDHSKLARADKSVLTIVGNTITPDYKIINIIRQTALPDVQIFRLDTKELEENIAQLQTVKKVYIRRYWFPARITVAIDERVPAFLLSPNLDSPPNSALTTDGILIDHDYLPFKTEVKAKKLLTYNIQDGQDEIWDKKKVEALIKLTRALESYSNQEVQYIDVRNKSDVYIMLKDYLIRFGEINDTALKRAKWIGSILPQAEKYGKQTKYIDLRWEDSRYIRLEGTKEDTIEGQASKETKKPVEKAEQIENKQQEQPQEPAQTTETEQENLD